MELTKKEKSSLRNWQKARVKSFCLDSRVLTEKETVLYNKIKELKTELLNSWDSETYKMSNKEMPINKCSWCGKRTNKDLIENLCSACSKKLNIN